MRLCKKAVAPPAGAWIETTLPSFWATATSVAPPAGAWIETLIVISLHDVLPGRASRRRVD